MCNFGRYLLIAIVNTNLFAKHCVYSLTPSTVIVCISLSMNVHLIFYNLQYI